MNNDENFFVLCEKCNCVPDVRIIEDVDTEINVKCACAFEEKIRIKEFFNKMKNNVNISDVNIYNYAKRTMDLLEPLYSELLNNLLHNEFNVIHADETPLKVIGSKKDKCYMFVYATSFWEKPIYIYDFNDSRSTKNHEKIQG